MMVPELDVYLWSLVGDHQQMELLATNRLDLMVVVLDLLLKFVLSFRQVHLVHLSVHRLLVLVALNQQWTNPVNISHSKLTEKSAH